jgi:hypothetical protein
VLRSAEILFNRVIGIHNIENYTDGGNYDPVAIAINQNGAAGVVHIYRNTFVGRVLVENTDDADGPFYFNENVIVNNDPGTRIAFDNVTAPSRVIVTDNLVGGPRQNVVDEQGNLIGNHKASIGKRGYQRAVPTGKSQ